MDRLLIICVYRAFHVRQASRILILMEIQIVSKDIFALQEQLQEVKSNAKMILLEQLWVESRKLIVMHALLGIYAQVGTLIHNDASKDFTAHFTGLVRHHQFKMYNKSYPALKKHLELLNF